MSTFLGNVNNKRAVVTSAASFLGSSLCLHLVEKGYEVLGIDNFSQNTSSLFAQLSSSPKVTLLNNDLKSEIEVPWIDADIFYHISPLTNENEIQDNSMESLLEISNQVKNALELAKYLNARFVLTTSISVYYVKSGLEEIYFKSVKQHKKFSKWDAQRFCEDIVFEYGNLHNLWVCVARVSSIYGFGMNLTDDRPFGEMLLQAMKSNFIDVDKENTSKNYYLYQEDACEGLIQLAKKNVEPNLIYPFSPIKGFTDFEIASLIASKFNSRIHLIDKENSEVGDVPHLVILDRVNSKKIGFDESVSLSEGIGRCVNAYLALQIKEKDDYKDKISQHIKLGKNPKKMENIYNQSRNLKISKNKPKKKKYINSNSKLTALFVSLALITYFYISPLIMGSYYAFQTYLTTQSAIESTRIADFSSTKIKIQESEVFVENSLVHFEKLFKYLPKSQITTDILFSLRSVKLLLQGGEGFFASSSEFLTKLALMPKQLSGEASKPEDVIRVEDLEKFNSGLKHLQTFSSLAKSEFSNTSFNYLPQSWVSFVTKVRFNIENFNTLVYNTEISSQAFEASFGFGRPHNIMILFQNNNELRPTGGFIGSYALLKLEQGRIEDFIVDDIYNLDGELTNKKIVVTPPKEVFEYLKQSNWGIRDANLDADFEDSVNNISYLYSLISKQQLDTVIAVDLNLFETLLEEYGDMQIPSYSEVVTARNLFELTQTHAESDFVPGSNAKASFLSALAKAFLLKISESDSNVGLLKAVNKGLEQKHLLISTKIFPLPSITRQLNWDGKIPEVKSDYLYVVDANVGANKSNYNTNRSIQYEVTNKDRFGHLASKLTINYVNTGIENEYPADIYKNLLRIYIPNGSILKSAFLKDSSKSDEDVLSKISQELKYDKLQLTTYLEVPPGKSINLELLYELSEAISIPISRKDYSLYIQKQPGTVGDGYFVSFQSPFGRTFEKFPDEFTLNADKLTKSGSLMNDEVFNFELQ